MKKFLSAIITASMLLSAVPAVNAASAIDYTDELNELKGLMDQCAEAGIPTDYEMVNYKTLERFVGYINEDLTADGTDYNISCMSDLYNEAKKNLEGYLAGTKKSFTVSRSNMSNISVSGGELTDGKGPVYSLGYGHFGTSQRDIPNFQSFGTNNIQMELGPNQVLKYDENSKKFIFQDSALSNLKTRLEDAEKNNIGITLLISPHYMVEGLSDEVYNNNSKSYFLKYNINHPEAKEILDLFVPTLVSQLKDYKALTSICISNEPMFFTNEYYDFYNEDFQKYLKEVHGNIANLNKVYGKNYSDFSEVNMPTSSDWTTTHTYTAVDYDWMEFNDKVFADWHDWLAEMVRNNLPGVPVHTKMMGYFEDGDSSSANDRKMLARGTDLEMLSANMDIAGNDTWDYMTNTKKYYRSMFLYDYQYSVLNKPVFNSEDHIIPDRDTTYNANQRKHLVNNLWMGATHGRSMSSMWIWERYKSGGSTDFIGSVLHRPDCVAAVGKTSLNLQRLNSEVKEIRQDSPKVALFYSKPSRLYHSDTMSKIMETYTALVNSGVKVGIVSDKSIDKLSQYDALVIPNAINGTDEAYDAIVKFANNGGRVLCKVSSLLSFDTFSKDEYNNGRSNTELKNSSDRINSLSNLDTKIREFVNSCGLGEVTLLDSNGDAPKNLDWTYTIDNRGILINITNLEYDTTKNLTVYYNGTELENMTDLISGKSGIQTVALEGYTPQLLSYNFVVDPDIEIMNISNENGSIKWDYSTENNIGANIYLLDRDGNANLVETVSGNEYVYSVNGTYVVRAIRDTQESTGRIITVTGNSDDMSITLNKISKSASSLHCNITLTNNERTYTTGVVAVRVLKEDGSVDNQTFNKITLAPGESTDFGNTMGISEDAVSVEIMTVDSTVSNGVMSNKIEKNFSELS